MPRPLPRFVADWNCDASFDARHPQPDSITYALNLDTGQAVWESPDERPDAWTSQFLGANPRTGSVADYIGDPDPRLHSPAPTVRWRRRAYGFSTAATGTGSRPSRASDRTGAGQHDRARGGIRSRRRRYRREAGAGSAAVNSSSASPWSINFWNPADTSFDLRIKIRDTGPVRVTARAGTPGLPSTPGTIYRDRPPETMPISGNPRIDRTGLLDGGDQVVQFHGAVSADGSAPLAKIVTLRPEPANAAPARRAYSEGGTSAAGRDISSGLDRRVSGTRTESSRVSRFVTPARPGLTSDAPPVVGARMRDAVCWRYGWAG